jgi:hypothetical protein
VAGVERAIRANPLTAIVAAALRMVSVCAMSVPFSMMVDGYANHSVRDPRVTHRRTPLRSGVDPLR